MTRERYGVDDLGDRVRALLELESPVRPPWYERVGRPFGDVKGEFMAVPDGAKERPDQWVAVMSRATAEHFRVGDDERSDFLGLGAAVGQLTGIEVLYSEAVPHRQVLFLPKALVDELRKGSVSRSPSGAVHGPDLEAGGAPEGRER